MSVNRQYILGRRLGEAGSAVDTGLLILGSVATFTTPGRIAGSPHLLRFVPAMLLKSSVASTKPELVRLQTLNGSSTIRLCVCFFSQLISG